MEALGTAITVVGMLGHVFDGCMKAYALFTEVNNFGRDSDRLVCKIRIEEMRLLVWGREWGVTEGRLEAHLKAETIRGNEKMGELAMQILTELYKTITDFGKLEEKYGFAAVEGERKKEGMSKFTNNLHLRTKWVIADKEKFGVFLADLKDYNDGLEQLFPPARVPTLHRSWTNELLETAERDLAELGLLESAADGVYEQLNHSAGLKKLKINMDDAPTKSFKPTYSLKLPRSTLIISDKGSRRSQGTYQTQANPEAREIIVEWLEYDKQDVDTRFNHVRRIDDMAKMIHSASERHPDLHTLNCLGYTDCTATNRYGLVYATPAASYSDLNALIGSNDLKTPELGDRFDLAHSLAIALWSLHSLDWLHKSICSNNILFFPSAFSNAAHGATAAAALVPEISYPYLIGFESSRPNELGDMSIASKNPASFDIYRHPSSLGGFDRQRYCKSFDIYSLGLVLLEIGLWKTLKTFHKSHYSAHKFRDRVVLGALVPSLGSKTGRRYKEVVEKCLSAQESMSSHEAGQLMESIVSALEGLRV